MTEAQVLSGMLNRAGTSLKDRPNMPKILLGITQNLRIAEDTFHAVNSAAEKLNEFISLPDGVAEYQSEFLMNCFRVRSIIDAKRIRTPRDLVGLSGVRTNGDDYKDCISTFDEIKARMVRAEQGERTEMIRAHLDGLDTEAFTDIMGIFLYSIRSLIANKRLNSYGHHLTYAIVEMLALHGFETRTFSSIKGLISDESISPMMRKIIDDDVDGLFEPGKVFRKSPNFEVVADNFEQEGVCKKGLLVIPTSVKGNTMLISATIMPYTTRIIRQQNQDEGLARLQFIAAGEFNTSNLRIALGGLRSSFDGEYQRLPSIETMESLITQGSLQYPH